MTVGYTEDVATCRGFGNFGKLLARWTGSIYKVVWAETIVYLVCFFGLNFFYRFYLNEDCEKRKIFIAVVKYCDKSSRVIPVSFILSFYVSNIVDRWWKRWIFLPWSDSTALTVSCCVDGHDERSRIIRRTIVRYANVAFVMCLQLISTLGKLRFPSAAYLVAAGFLNEHEQKILEDMDEKIQHPKYYVPLVWAGTVARIARREGRIRDDISLNNVITTINAFRKGCQEMMNYDWVNVPLVYTQATTLAVYTYFLASLVGNQLTVITGVGEPVDFYFPFFNFFEFFFYFGWLKIAEVFINPFGVDDDDFEVNWLVDRYFEVAYVIVDEMHQEHPNLLKDQYWDDVYPIELPYTEATLKYRLNEGLGGSTKNIDIPEEKATFLKYEESEDKSKGTSAKSSSLKRLFLERTPSKNSLTDPHVKAIPSTPHSAIRAKHGAGQPSGKESASEAARHARSKESKHSDNSSDTFVPVGPNSKRNKGGYWAETGEKSQVNLQDLMEKDDVVYDPTKDIKKESEIKVEHMTQPHRHAILFHEGGHEGGQPAGHEHHEHDPHRAPEHGGHDQQHHPAHGISSREHVEGRTPPHVFSNERFRSQRPTSSRSHGAIQQHGAASGNKKHPNEHGHHQ